MLKVFAWQRDSNVSVDPLITVRPAPECKMPGAAAGHFLFAATQN